MTDISPNPGLGLPDDASGPFGSAWARSASLAEFAAQRVPWKRVLKFAAGLTLLGFGAITTYEQVIVRVSREAVVNARVLSVRAPIDGVLHSTKAVPGAGVPAGTPIAQVDDPVPDNARLFQLQLDAAAAQRERETFARKLTDLQQARAAALATSEAFRLGRIRQDEVRIEEARATLAAATVRQTEA